MPFASREGGLRVEILVAMAGPLALGACVAPIVRNDPPALDHAALRAGTFTMVEAGTRDPWLIEARDAVTRALADQGLRQSADAPYRVDVGFAAAPLPLRVAEVRDAHGAPPPRGIALCRRRQYVLSVAMIDRRDGEVVFRNSATAHRCAKALAKTLPRLARVALGR